MTRLNSSRVGLPKTFEIPLGGCLFAASLYACAAGGFDLHLNLNESELDRMDVATITALRKMCDDRTEIFVTHLSIERYDPRLRMFARRELTRWLEQETGLRRTFFDWLKLLAMHFAKDSWISWRP